MEVVIYALLESVPGDRSLMLSALEDRNKGKDQLVTTSSKLQIVKRPLYLSSDPVMEYSGRVQMAEITVQGPMRFSLQKCI